MKQIYSIIVLLLAFAVSKSHAEVPTYNMGTKDGSNGEQTVDGELLFYDSGGPNGASGGFQTGFVRFKAKNAGEPLTIEFLKPVEFSNTDNSHLYIYDGESGYPATGGWKKPVPEGYVADLTNGSSFTYTAADGVIDVLFYADQSSPKESGNGWEARLYTAPPTDMEWNGISATQDFEAYCYPGLSNAPVICVDLNTNGSLNPLALTQIDFTMSGSFTAADIAAVRCLYSKSSTNPASGTPVGVSYSTTDGTLSFTDNIELGNGHNYIWLVVDISSEATPGHTLDASVTKAMVAGENRIAGILSPEGERIISSTLLMESGTHEYRVGDIPINFYDDGGPSGSYTQNFNGTTIFYPATDEKKVSIEFNTLDLFNTASSISVGNNDVIKVYNGSTISEANLLATIIQNTDLAKVFSTSSDGALTVTFVSKTGYPTGGFAATVSLFEPEAMTIDTIISASLAPATVSSGSTEPFLNLDIQTINTEPAVTTSAFTFTVSQPEGAIANATLYYTGITADGTPVKIGEAVINGNTMTVSPEQPVELGQNHNYFRLDVTVSGNAQNNDIITITPVSVTSGGNVINVNNAVSVSSTISNKALSVAGTKSYTIYGPWSFANSPSAYSYYGYDSTNEQVTTFYPGKEGNKVEIEFSKLSIAFPSYSYSGDPSFKVISGTDKNGMVLYEVKRANKNDGVPTTIFRSEDPSGAITVVFNPNGQRGTSTSNGFTATVSLYEEKAMELKSVEGVQAASSDIAPGSVGNAIAGLRFTTEGAMSPLSLSEVEVKYKGCAPLLKAVHLYAGSDAEAFDITASTLLATDSLVSGCDSTVFNCEYTLPERTSYLWVVYDMADKFASDLDVDASFGYVTVNGEKISVTNPDPEGASVTKNNYFFSGNAIVDVDGTMMFYDDGGPEGKYTTANSGTVTFRPANIGDIVKFHFQSFYTNIYDHFTVYNGTGTDGEILAEYYSSKSDLPDIVSTSADGALTVAFNPTRNGTNDGWAIEVTAFTPQPLRIDSIAASDVTPGRILRGSADNSMIHAAITIGGDMSEMHISELDFDAMGSTLPAISSATVYYTGTSDVFATDDVYATDSTGNMTFTGDVTLRLPGTHHFWLAYNVTPDADSSSKFAAKLKSVKVDNSTYTYDGSVYAETALSRGMKGSYTVGKNDSADYASITAAIAALQQQGMEGAVTIEVEDGEYTEHVELPAIAGNSPLNTLTLRSKSRKRDNVLVNWEINTGGSDYQSKHGVLTLSGINYATIEDMSFSTQYDGMDAVVWVKGYSRFDTIRNCHISTPTRTNIQKDVNLIRMAAIDEANRNNDCFSVENCLLEGGYIGLYIGGTSYVALPRERGARLIGNTLRNQGSKGIYICTEDDAEIRDNIVIQQGYEMATGYNAMDIYRAGGDFVCSGNIIDVTDCQLGTSTYGGTVTGIYVRGTNTNTSLHRYYNNDVSMQGTRSNTLYGFQISDNVEGVQRAEIQNNTFAITGTGKDYSTAVYLNTWFGNGNIFRNNILLSDMTGYAMRINKIENITDATLGNNALYSVTDSILGGIGNDDFNYAEFCNTVAMTGCVNEKPTFLTSSIHELAQPGNLECGIPVDYITVDLAGRLRSSSAPTLGAYEYVDQNVAPVISDGYPRISNVDYNSVVINISSSLASHAYVLVLDTLQTTPDVTAVLASNRMVTTRSLRPAEIEIPGLRPNTTYKAYVVLRSMGGNASDVYSSEMFTTPYQPTTVSTFENLETGITNFMDGTASFTGFKVVEQSGAPGVAPSAKVAEAIGNATITLTNAFDLPLDGFFLSNNDTVKLVTYNAAGQAIANKQLLPEEWRYINLRDMGLISSLTLASADTLYIDDFSGTPLELLGAIGDAPSSGTEGEMLNFTGMVYGGVSPYSIEWSDAAGNILSHDNNAAFSLAHSSYITMNVTDAWGNNVSDRTPVRITGNAYPATFDDLTLTPESHWNGVEDGRGYFFSGSWEFPVYYMPDYDSWAWFGYANSSSTDFNGIADQFNNVTGSGYRSRNYGVVFASSYWGNCVATQTANAEGDTIPGVYVTNSAWVKDAIINGDGMSNVAGGFRQDDYLMLTLRGTRADNSTIEKEFYLADFRDENPVEHYYLNDWEWLDLSDMGKITQLAFSISGTKSNAYGLTTPSYVIIDNLGGNLMRDTLSRQIVQLQGSGEKPARLNLASVFEVDSTQGKVTYMLPEGQEGITLSANGEVSIMRPRGSSFTLLADMRQHGHTSYVAIPVSVDTEVGVESVTANDVKIWPVPARECLNVDLDRNGYTVEIFNLNGMLVAKAENCTGHVTLSLDNLSAGNYIVRITHPQISYTRKIVVSK